MSSNLPPTQTNGAQARRKIHFASFTAATAIVLFAATGACAADLPDTNSAPPPYFVQDDFWTRQHLLGDWGGIRTGLHNLGIDVTLSALDEAVGNLSGGTRNTVQQAGQAVLHADVDLQKIIGLDGGSLSMTLVGRWGANEGAIANIPALMLINKVYGRGNIVRLENLSYTQRLFGDLVELKVGRLAVGDDFSFQSCDFLNLTFCGSPPGFIEGNYVYSWPISRWGGIAKVNFGTSPRAQYAMDA